MKSINKNITNNIIKNGKHNSIIYIWIEDFYFINIHNCKTCQNNMSRRIEIDELKDEEGEKKKKQELTE